MEVPLLSSSSAVPFVSQDETSKTTTHSATGSHKEAVAQAEDTPAYRVLQQYGLLDATYRKEHFDDIFDSPKDLTANSSKAQTLKKRFQYGVYWTPGCGWMIYNIFNTEVVVPPGHVQCFVDNDNNYLFAKPGVHNITNPFLQKIGYPIPVVQEQVIEHGNRTVVTIPQGKLGFATNMGQPVLLPPGLHSWTSETLRYKRTFGLDEHIIEVGPYTILTVDEGYSAITQNNGLQVVLDGGMTHLLTHQKWRFEKFITLKIQTDDLERIRAASADNVIMEVNSTVVWRIKDVRVAATMAAETMAHGGNNASVSADITKLRRDVLKQAIASLAGFIGSVNYSDSFHVAAAAQRNMETATEVIAIADGNDAPCAVSVEHQTVARDAPPQQQQVQPRQPRSTPSNSTDNPIFNAEGMSEAVSHANQITSKFGVEILSINIISANPVDDALTASLATGAVASAEALQAETQARGMAKAMKIKADANAITRKIDADSQALATLVKARSDGEAEKVRAEGAKAAEILRAEGSQRAAQLIEGSKVAVTLETLKASAASIRTNDKFFFGQEPGYMPNVILRAPDAARDTGDDDDDESGEYLVTNMAVSSSMMPRNLD